MSEVKEKTITDSTYNSNFQELLDKFHAIIDTSDTKTNEKLEALKEEAKTKQLTFRQSDAIYARCVNYVSGTYGSTSKENKIQNIKK